MQMERGGRERLNSSLLEYPAPGRLTHLRARIGPEAPIRGEFELVFFAHEDRDLERERHPRALEPDDPNIFTWWAPWRNMRQRNVGWRIDYLLASKGIASRVTSCAVLADVGTSDHAPVMLSVG